MDPKVVPEPLCRPFAGAAGGLPQEMAEGEESMYLMNSEVLVCMLMYCINCIQLLTAQ